MWVNVLVEYKLVCNAMIFVNFSFVRINVTTGVACARIVIDQGKVRYFGNNGDTKYVDDFYIVIVLLLKLVKVL